MTPTAIIEKATADGVRIALTGTGTIKASGDQAAVSRWVPIIREHKPGIVAALREAGIDPIKPTPADKRIERVGGKLDPGPELFTFSPPGDPANDDEALQERVAIMMEGNGWDEATALREARWCADRERCWRGFLLNAQRIVDAPRAQREGLLGRYRREARERYGEATAACMATSMTAWIAGRGLH